MENGHIEVLQRSKASWLYPIYVPSYNRAGSAPLLELLKRAPYGVQRKVHIVVRDTEVDTYKDHYPWARIVSQKPPYGIGPARMRCLQDASKRGFEHLVMLDDDIIHVSLLERVAKEKGEHSRRYSSRVSGTPEPELMLRSLAVACEMSSALFRWYPRFSYGALRNALFSGGVDTSVSVTSNSGSFPACVMMINLDRFHMRKMPKEYQYHGEDLAMFLENMESGAECFTIQTIAYDQSTKLETTIPLDPQDSVARTPDLENSKIVYPMMYPYLKASMKNEAGGIMRVGMNWKKWYNDTATTPVKIKTVDLLNGMRR